MCVTIDRRWAFSRHANHKSIGRSTIYSSADQLWTGAELHYLDEAATRAAADADPASFVHHDRLMFIDEVQRVPDLLLAIKHEVDVDPRP